MRFRYERFLKLLRKRKIYVSYQALADELQVSKKSVSEWAKGKVDPEAESLVRLADYLGASVDYLLGRVEESSALSSEITPRMRMILEALSEFDEGEVQSILRAFQALKRPGSHDKPFQ